ncbi:MAG: very short patch repair endonuclease [Candidatus Sedimenticola sp. 6PFRAG7]
MSDVHTPEKRSYNMSRIRGSNTAPEILLRKKLWAAGLRYRLKVKISGKPDLVFLSARVAVFVDGCFWHGCPEHYISPKTNAKFWRDKINKNKIRDEVVKKELESEGWCVIRLWEHEIENDVEQCVEKIRTTVGESRQRRSSHASM